MRDYNQELTNRIAFIQDILKNAHAQGIVYGNSGGKDCTLVSILCKKACDNTIGIIMPCQSKRNYGEDTDDALATATQFGIETLTVDLTDAKTAITDAISKSHEITAPASSNIAPRIRMTTLYAVAQSRNALVAGTGNKSELYMGYFTKWGDGGCDFNPIADLTVTEVYEFLEYLNAPQNIIKKAPSAGLFEGQTDETEMGVTYAQIDQFIQNQTGDTDAIARIKRYHETSHHKRQMPLIYRQDKL